MADDPLRCVCIELLSVLGRKHIPFFLNEDRVFTFSFSLDTCVLGALDSNDSSKPLPASNATETPIPTTIQNQQRVSIAVLIDGHGARPRVTPTPEELRDVDGGRYRTPGDWFVSLVETELPSVMRRVCALDPELLSRYISNCSVSRQMQLPPPPTTNASAISVKSYLAKLHHLLCHLREIINDHLGALQPRLCHGAGSTLCMGLRVFDEFFCINVGDSCMMALSEPNSAILPIWSSAPLVAPVCAGVPEDLRPLRDVTPGLAAASARAFPCSYEDTLVDFPSRVREGQDWHVVERDFDYVRPNLKPNRAANTLCSPLSNKNLRMVNTLGNLGHRAVLVPRTTVYRFELGLMGGPVSFLLMTDGIKDMFTAGEIASIHACKSAPALAHTVDTLTRTALNSWPSDNLVVQMQMGIEEKFAMLEQDPNRTFVGNTAILGFGSDNAEGSARNASSGVELAQAHVSLRKALERFARLYSLSHSLDEVSVEAINAIIAAFADKPEPPPSSASADLSQAQPDHVVAGTQDAKSHQIHEARLCCTVLVYLARLKGSQDDVSCILWRFG